MARPTLRSSVICLLAMTLAPAVRAAGPTPTFNALPQSAMPLATPPMSGMRPPITPVATPLAAPPAPVQNTAATPARPDFALCRTAIAAAERAAFVPDRLMHAIGIMESGRRDPSGTAAPWPWTINVEGVGEVFDTKQQAIAAVTAHQARGARSIDVGCMQVNLMHHRDAFASLDDAFDPVANTRYAARFLLKLLDQTGSWPRAVAGYHSLTPDIGDAYAKKVLAIWARPDPARDPARTARLAPAPGPAVAGVEAPSITPALPGGAPARLLAAPGSVAPSLTGRGLDSYRAIPTRLAANSLWRRS